jgi:hypothetical protein
LNKQVYTDEKQKKDRYPYPYGRREDTCFTDISNSHKRDVIYKENNEAKNDAPGIPPAFYMGAERHAYKP